MAPDFNGKPPAIEPGSLVLVTGANGFIGSHVTDQLLQAGYRVRGTARDTGKTQWLTKLFTEKYGAGKFEASVVKDMSQTGAFDEVCKGVSAVCHVASILPNPNKFDPNEVIPVVTSGALNAISSAAKYPSIKRFTYTSSSTAITAPKPNIEFTISTEDWNHEDVEAAWKPPPYDSSRAWAVYGASKTQAEMEIWKFGKEKRPSFVINCVLPNANIGEILYSEQPASTGEWVKAIYEGNVDAVKDIPPQYFVNVRDNARIHVATLLDPDVQNERILAFAEPFNWNDVIVTLKNLFPGRSFPDEIKDLPRDLSKLDHSRGEELLKAFGQPGFTSFEESVKQNTAHL